MKILIFEDDIFNYHQLRNIIEENDAACEVIGPFTTMEQGRDYLMQHRDVDIIITDVMLSDTTTFAALDHAPSYTPIIFITSHEEYALRAFSYLSLSYLIKPVSEEHLTQALARAMRLRKAAAMLTPTGGWIKEKERTSRLIAKTLHGERVIHVAMIRYIVSEQKNTYVKLLDGTSYRLDRTLEQTEMMLGSDFMRVNRKYIVPAEQIIATKHIENGKMLLLLKGDNAPHVVVSRTRKVDVCKWLNSN